MDFDRGRPKEIWKRILFQHLNWQSQLFNRKSESRRVLQRPCLRLNSPVPIPAREDKTLQNWEQPSSCCWWSKQWWWSANWSERWRGIWTLPNNQFCRNSNPVDPLWPCVHVEEGLPLPVLLQLRKDQHGEAGQKPGVRGLLLCRWHLEQEYSRGLLHKSFFQFCNTNLKLQIKPSIFQFFLARKRKEILHYCVAPKQSMITNSSGQGQQPRIWEHMLEGYEHTDNGQEFYVWTHLRWDWVLGASSFVSY